MGGLPPGCGALVVDVLIFPPDGVRVFIYWDGVMTLELVLCVWLFLLGE